MIIPCHRVNQWPVTLRTLNCSLNSCATKKKLSDTCSATQVLRTLPEKYRSLRQSFKMLDPTRKTMTTLTEMLLQEDAEFTARDKAKAACVKAKVRTYQTHSSKNKSAEQITDGKTETSGGEAAKFKCWTCRQQGHLKRDCPKRKQRKLKTENVQDKEEHDAKRQAFSSITAGCKGKRFLANSGASMHVCNDAELFNFIDDSRTRVKSSKQAIHASIWMWYN